MRMRLVPFHPFAFGVLLTAGGLVLPACQFSKDANHQNPPAMDTTTASSEKNTSGLSNEAVVIKNQVTDENLFGQLTPQT